MKKQQFTHTDCYNFAPVDVAKGICHRTKDLILGDDLQCEHFERKPKCKFCTQFTPGKEEFLGNCEALKDRPVTYPDLITTTCEPFKFVA